MSLAARSFSSIAFNPSSATTPSQAYKRTAMAFGPKLPHVSNMRFRGIGTGPDLGLATLESEVNGCQLSIRALSSDCRV
jgi:hypothetical protein